MAVTREPLFHGGVPGLRKGELIVPGKERRSHAGCPWCEARARGEAGPDGIDPPSEHTDRVYATPNRLYAKYYASLWGYGDLYRVSSVGEVEPSTEDTVETVTAPAWRVEAVLDRAVLLTPSERRRLQREWGAADAAVRARRRALVEANLAGLTG